MAPDNTPGTDNLAAVNDQYKQRVDGLAAADDKANAEREEAEADSGLESVDAPLVEEARFVGNPDDLRKSESSEEEFSEGHDDGDDDLESMEPASKADKAEAPAKKTAAKRG